MRRIIIRVAFSLTLGLFALSSMAQESSSLGAFSPYTMYGLGEFNVGGNTASRLMGGVGVAARRGDMFNYLNPASLSAIPRNCALFNFGTEGQNYYSQTSYAKTSFNNFDMHDLGLAFPLARGMGFSFSLTPLTSVGYRSTIIYDNPSIIENIGRTVYNYSGEGGLSQLSASFGMVVLRGLSLGVSGHYNFGTIDRYYSAAIYPEISASSYRSVESFEKIHVSQMSVSFGAQYAVRVGPEATITVGATFAPRIKVNADKTHLSLSNSSYVSDTISFSESKFPISLPQKYAVGIFFSNKYIGVGVDYSNQDWSGAFDVPTADKITLRAQEDIKFGIQYTPDKYSIRSPLSRWTYKAGFRYGTSYLMRNNVPLREYALSFGVDIPLSKRNPTAINVGFELGQRGAKMSGQVLEQYWKMFVGVSLFGDDMWFKKRKFN